MKNTEVKKISLAVPLLLHCEYKLFFFKFIRYLGGIWYGYFYIKKKMWYKKWSAKKYWHLSELDARGNQWEMSSLLVNRFSNHSDVMYKIRCTFTLLYIIFNPYTNGLSEVCCLTACRLDCPQICGQIYPQP
jgi:hypothetical protein